MSTPVRLILMSDEVVPQPIPAVEVAIYTTGGTFVTSGSTDGVGDVNFLLPDNPYDVLFYKQGMSILPKQPQRIIVDSMASSNEFTVTAHIRVLPEALDPTLCRISGYSLGVTGRPVPSRINLALVPEIYVSNPSQYVTPNEVIEISSDQSGYFEFDVIRGVRYKGYFAFVDRLLDMCPLELDIRVPDQPGLTLSDFLFPVPVHVEFSATTMNLTMPTADESTTVDVLFSDGSDRSVPYPQWTSIQV